MGAWLGTIVAVSFLVAPMVFRNLPRETAGQVMGRIFSAYYVLGIMCGMVALAAMVVLSVRLRWNWERLVAVLLLTTMVSAAGYARLILTPGIFEVRAHVYAAELAEAPEAPALRDQLDALHDRSVRLNAAVLLGCVLLLLIGAVREQQADLPPDAVADDLPDDLPDDLNEPLEDPPEQVALEDEGAWEEKGRKDEA